MNRIPSYLVAGAIALALLFYTFGKLDEFFGRQDADIVAASRAALAAHPALVRWRDKLAAVQAAKTRAEQRWRDSADALADAAAALTDTTVAGLHEAVFLWTAVAQARDSQARSCAVARTACEQRALSAEAEADSLTHRLAAQITVRDHPCGVFVGGGVGTGGKAEAQVGVGCRVLRFPWP